MSRYCLSAIESDVSFFASNWYNRVSVYIYRELFVRSWTDRGNREVRTHMFFDTMAGYLKYMTALCMAGMLMLTGCGSGNTPAPAAESASEDMTEAARTAETVAEEAAEEEVKVTTETARVGICFARSESGDNERLLTELQEALLQRGFVSENLMVQRLTGSRSTQREEIEECLEQGCNLIIAAAVSDKKIGEIADLVTEAGASVLFVNCVPGEEELQRWTDQGINAAWIGSTYEEELACQLSILYDYSGTEKGLDFNGDGHVGTLLIGGGDKAKEALEETVRDLGSELRILDELDDESDEDISGYTQEILNTYKKETELIVCSSEKALKKAADGVQLRHRLVGRDILVIGIGTDEEICTGIINKLMSGSTFVDFYEQANLASVASKDMIEGNRPDRMISNVIFKVTEENAQEVLDQLWNTRNTAEEQKDSEEQEDHAEQEEHEGPEARGMQEAEEEDDE